MLVGIRDAVNSVGARFGFASPLPSPIPQTLTDRDLVKGLLVGRPKLVVPGDCVPPGTAGIYGLLHPRTGALLKVGASFDIARRITEHRCEDPEWNQYPFRYQQTRRLPTPAELFAAERLLILRHQPPFNLTRGGNGGIPAAYRVVTTVLAPAPAYASSPVFIACVVAGAVVVLGVGIFLIVRRNRKRQLKKLSAVEHDGTWVAKVA
jgi:hypothetical protein